MLVHTRSSFGAKVTSHFENEHPLSPKIKIKKKNKNKKNQPDTLTLLLFFSFFFVQGQDPALLQIRKHDSKYTITRIAVFLHPWFSPRYIYKEKE